MNAEEKTFIVRNERFQFFPKAKIAEIEFVVRNMHVVSAGTFAATGKHEKLIPNHGLALSTEISRDHFNVISVDLETALQYLRRDALALEPNYKKGFALMEFQGLLLGWINVLDNRVNNLYPQEWRIRMR